MAVLHNIVLTVKTQDLNAGQILDNQIVHKALIAVWSALLSRRKKMKALKWLVTTEL